MKGFLNGLGLSLLWIILMVVLPIIISILYGYFTGFRDAETGKIVFWVSFIGYWLLTAVVLILI